MHRDEATYRVYAQVPGSLEKVAIGFASANKADALLVSASPELIEYCKSLLADAQQLVEDPTVSVDNNWDWQLTVQNLTELIAKTDGGVYFPSPSLR